MNAERPQPALLHERILVFLAMATRPLRSDEVHRALALVPEEAHAACEWLCQYGYIHRQPTSRMALAGWALIERPKTKRTFAPLAAW